MAVGSAGGASKAAIDGTDIGEGAMYGAVGGAAGRYTGNVTRSILDKYAPSIAQNFGTFVQAGISVEGKIVGGLAQQGLRAIFPDTHAETASSMTSLK